MSNHRYHIHLICAPDDQISVIDNLAIFFEDRAFVTRDLNLGTFESSNYSRRCIDESDLVLLLIGENYGKLNKTGVSQLHLSYINAETKNKPMLILRKVHKQHVELSRQLANFIRLVEQHNSGKVLHYDEDTDFEILLATPFQELVTAEKITGWVPSQFSPKATPGKTKVKDKKSPKDDVEQKKTTEEVYEAVDDVDSDLMLNFTTHAYEGGNLSEVSFMAVLTWREVLESLVALKTQFTAGGLERCVNDLVHEQALELVQDVNPKAHAVSRTQVSEKEQDWVRGQMLATGWIKVVSRNKKTKKELLGVTSKGKKVVA